MPASEGLGNPQQMWAEKGQESLVGEARREGTGVTSGARADEDGTRGFRGRRRHLPDLR